MAVTPVDAARFGSLTVVSVGPDARDGVQRRTRDGMPRWRVQCLRSVEGCDASLVAVVVASPSAPVLAPMSVPEAAALSGIPYKVVNAAVKSGDLESCYAGSSTVRIRWTDLDDWVAALPDDWC